LRDIAEVADARISNQPALLSRSVNAGSDRSEPRSVNNDSSVSARSERSEPRSVNNVGSVSASAVTGVTHDSASVRPGDLYAALPGARRHGAEFAGAAVAAGAVAVLTDSAGAALLNGSGAGALSVAGEVPVLVVADPRAILGGFQGLRPPDPATLGHRYHWDRR
jgi:hypothetical protein